MLLNLIQKRLITEILATTTAIWQPIRDWSGNAGAAKYELQQRFTNGGGIRWASGELSGAGRKSAQRALEGLADAGLVEVRRQSGRASLVKLTDRGEAVGYRLAGEFICRSYALERMQQLADLTGQTGACIDGFVPEPLLVGRKWGDGCEDLLWHAQLDLLPALVAGWVAAQSSIHGHVWYSLTTAGHDVLDGKVELPTFDDLPPSAGDDGQRQYVGAVKAARSRIRELKLTHPGEIGYLPRSLGVPAIQEID